MTPLIWCILILAIGLALIFLEMFIPSAGALSFLAAIAVIASIVLAYVQCGLATGTIFTVVGIVLVPAAIFAALKVYPNTPFGRRILAVPPKPEEVAPHYDRTAAGQPLKGQIGKAKTPLLPGGSVKIDATTYDAVSEGEPIDRGDVVLVVRVDGNHLVVRKVDGPLPPRPPDAIDPSDLSQPIESLGIDPFENPLG